jgi:formylglycine-generating enzyme required for sulfatase activity
MSGRDDPPAAGLLAGLQDLLKKKADAAGRFRPAWQMVVQAAGHPDFPVLLDFALEHGLVRSCAADAAGRELNLTWVNPADGSEMVWVGPGPFHVGPYGKRPAEAPGFSLARHPVTNAQFGRFLDATGYAPPADHPDNDRFLAHWVKGQPPRKKEQHPVVWVSFVDAVHYCRWAGLTLPTEWLWEKAARGPDGRPYPWGDAAPGKESPWARVGAADTCPVGSFPRTRTAYGCEDMVGNVSEWCQMLGDDPANAPAAPPDARPPADGTTEYAAVRGSAFMRTAHLLMRCWCRRRLATTRRNYWTGLRPALLLPCRPAE